ncbi:putative esterase [Rhizomicrobium palustre]|uniref:Putative esterase n=1 Tax=Rhizomicrobium palustre TaxID=189966 RepID=A0A846MVI5_9PROT|nr:alpha/beta hydrolase-fold protein [Rhizomicrobium palustre]NIK87494.1 putative esterase [Rhizomicrobium palustre]
MKFEKYCRLAAAIAMFCGLFLAGSAARGQSSEEHRLYAPTPEQIKAIDRVRGAKLSNFSAQIFQSSLGPIPYRMLSPTGATAAPLVIILHGSGQIGSDNLGQMGFFAKAWGEPSVAEAFPAYIAVPQVPTRSADYAADKDGNLHSFPSTSFASLLELIDHLCKTLPIDQRRVYLVGFSMGASTAMDLLLARPDRFTAAVAFSPVPPSLDQIAQVANKPLLLIHGSADVENPYISDRLWFEALTSRGGHAHMIVYDGMDHRLPLDMMLATDWRAWLFRQKS